MILVQWISYNSFFPIFNKSVYIIQIYLPKEIKNYWQELLANKISNYKRTNYTKSSNLKQPNQTHKEPAESLSIYEQNEIDMAVLKAWIAAGIPIETIDNPFM